MKSMKLAFLYFLLAYIMSSIVNLVFYYFNTTVMCIAMFALVALIFGYFFYLYLKRTKCDLARTLKETNLLIVFWILASLLLDGIIYILIFPLLYGYNPTWVFFTDQIAWLCFNYGMIIIVGYISRYLYVRRLKKFRKPD
ncbi:hypothetical protein JW879_08350 [candidate division WOR-3 bacterium]|nr:hypothetical protein [candidate division WOR-3 bacterium]